MNTTKCWKWTRKDYRTACNTLWGEGVKHSVPEWTSMLCADGVIHAYQDPWLAVLMAPAIGYDYEDSILWEAEAGGRLVIESDKIGCRTLRTIRQVEPPVITMDQRVEIAVRCALAVSPKRRKWAERWREWAGRWLSGEDRGYKSANTIAVDTESSVPYDDAHIAAVHAAAAAAHAAHAAHAVARAIYAVITDHDLNIIAIIRRVCEAEKEGGTAAMNTMKCWKWTQKDYRTYRDTLWGEEIEHSVPKWTGMLCTRGVIHAYQDPRLAVLVGLTHGYDPKNCLLWEAEARGRLVVASDKLGCETLKTIRRVEPPVITMDQRVEITIRCAMAVLPDHEWAQTWRAWAEKWLSGEDRSYKSANIIAVDTDPSDPYDDTHIAAVYAAYAAANTAYAAVRAAYAARSVRDLDIITIIHQVCGEEKEEVQP